MKSQLGTYFPLTEVVIVADHMENQFAVIRREDVIEVARDPEHVYVLLRGLQTPVKITLGEGFTKRFWWDVVSGSSNVLWEYIEGPQVSRWYRHGEVVEAEDDNEVEA